MVKLYIFKISSKARLCIRKTQRGSLSISIETCAHPFNSIYLNLSRFVCWTFFTCLIRLATSSLFWTALVLAAIKSFCNCQSFSASFAVLFDMPLPLGIPSKICGMLSSVLFMYAMSSSICLILLSSLS